MLDDSDAGENERTSFENIYFELIGEVKAILKVRFESLIAVDRLSAVHAESVVGSTSNDQVRSMVKLPPISIPTFDGDYNHWLEFKDIFTALVHDNDTLTNIQRFYYLRASLVKEAAQSIKSLQVSSDNYALPGKVCQIVLRTKI